MLFKDKVYSPVLVLEKFFTLLRDVKQTINKIEKKEHRKWNRIKLYYYVFIKYYKVRKYAADTFKKDLELITDDESKFITILVQYFSFVAFYAGTLQYRTVNEVIHKVFTDADVYTNTDDIEDYEERINTPIYKFTAIMRGKESFMDYKNKFTITKIIADLDTRTYELEQNIYDCANYFDSKTAKVLYHNYFKVGEDGDLHNPNYVFDNTLKEDDYEKYDYMIYHLMKLFGQVMINSIELRIRNA